jgi:hypothetical protein|tara:strand:+ start:1970 stop:2254 length:285 start_codon:yes stop_codon:yes gene_type:complete
MKAQVSKMMNIVIPYGQTGAIANKIFNEKFRTFSVYNNSGTCTVTIMENGNVMTIPVGVTVNFDAATEGNNIINKFPSQVFKVNATDCVVVGTI